MDRMTFQQEVIRQFTSTVNAQLMTATQKGPQQHPRSSRNGTYASDRVTSLHGRRPMQGGLCSPALSESLHSIASSSRPSTTPSYAESLLPGRASRLSYGSSTDLGGSPLPSPLASVPATRRPSSRGASNASLLGPLPPTVDRASKPLRPTGVDGSGARPDSKGLDQHPQAPSRTSNIANERIRGRPQDDARESQGRDRLYERKLDAANTQPQASASTGDDAR